MSIIDIVLDCDVEKLKECVTTCDVNEQDSSNGFTALHYCAQNGYIDKARILLENGASVCIKDDYGNTALFKAVFFSKGKTEIIQLLLDAGADPDAENNAGMSARRLADNIATFDVSEVFK